MDQTVKKAAESLLQAANSALLPAAVREGLRESASALVRLDRRLVEIEAMHAELVEMRNAAREVLSQPEKLEEWRGAVEKLRGADVKQFDALAIYNLAKGAL